MFLQIRQFRRQRHGERNVCGRAPPAENHHQTQKLLRKPPRRPLGRPPFFRKICAIEHKTVLDAVASRWSRHEASTSPAGGGRRPAGGSHCLSSTRLTAKSFELSARSVRRAVERQLLQPHRFVPDALNVGERPLWRSARVEPANGFWKCKAPRLPLAAGVLNSAVPSREGTTLRRRRA